MDDPNKEGARMAEHKTGTREEWEAARAELAKLEGEHAERNNEIKTKRRELPWVPVEKEYEFDTEEGKKTLDELFDGGGQRLAAHASVCGASCCGRCAAA